MIDIESYINPEERLHQLIADNPDLPLYPVLEIDLKWEKKDIEYLTRYYHYGALYAVQIDEIVEPKAGKIYYKSDRIYYPVLREYIHDIPRHLADKLFDEVPPWEKVIVLYFKV